jgi:ribosomal protein S18 acetylase RimI-like enzyme
MIIRKAKLTDIDRLSELLYEVHKLHARHRPDVFKKRKQKYTKKDLESVLTNELTPVWVAEEKKQVVGYLFGIYEEIKDHQSMTDRKTLYIDDLCVDKDFRKKGIGRQLYNYAKMVARTNGCYDITLNVWNLNPGAIAFYEKLGMQPMKVYMEEIL